MKCFIIREILYDKNKDALPIVTGLKMVNGSIVKGDVYVAALDIPGAKRLIPQDWRSMKLVFAILLFKI